MSVYKKLQTVAVELQKTDIKKSGNNKFAGFKYFELADFLPTVNELLLKNGLAGYCSFTSSLGTLTIVDVEDGSKVEVTSPMVEIEMKGANAIQALGAVETYTRRYLYLAALGIVENDVVDSKPLESDSKATQKQVSMIRGLANGETMSNILKYYKVSKIEDLTSQQAGKAIEALQRDNGNNN